MGNFFPTKSRTGHPPMKPPSSHHAAQVEGEWRTRVASRQCEAGSRKGKRDFVEKRQVKGRKRTNTSGGGGPSQVKSRLEVSLLSMQPRHQNGS